MTRTEAAIVRAAYAWLENIEALLGKRPSLGAQAAELRSAVLVDKRAKRRRK